MDVETSLGCGSPLKCSAPTQSQLGAGAGSTWPTRGRRWDEGGHGTRTPEDGLGCGAEGQAQQQKACAHLHCSPPFPLRPPRRAEVEDPLLSLHRDGDHPGCCSPASSHRHESWGRSPSSAGGSPAVWAEEVPGSVRDPAVQLVALPAMPPGSSRVTLLFLGEFMTCPAPGTAGWERTDCGRARGHSPGSLSVLGPHGPFCADGKCRGRSLRLSPALCFGGRQVQPNAHRDVFLQRERNTT